MIQERDDLKSRLRRGQGDLSPVERSELERQLSATKKDLFEERKSSRARMDQLEEVRSYILSGASHSDVSTDIERRYQNSYSALCYGVVSHGDPCGVSRMFIFTRRPQHMHLTPNHGCFDHGKNLNTHNWSPMLG